MCVHSTSNKQNRSLIRQHAVTCTHGGDVVAWHKNLRNALVESFCHSGSVFNEKLVVASAMTILALDQQPLARLKLCGHIHHMQAAAVSTHYPVEVHIRAA